jgi:predicted regulator of Ras-like GTPase activity (Roadblock/LC7/MglB family)
VRSPASTPSAALRELSKLTGDVRAAVVLGRDGKLLAAQPDGGARGERLRELTLTVLEGAESADGGRGADVEVGTQAGVVHVVRGDGPVLSVVVGRFVLSSLMRYDLHQVLAGLDEGSE